MRPTVFVTSKAFQNASRSLSDAAYLPAPPLILIP